MSEPAILRSTLQANADRILAEITTAGKPVTAWELKMKLHLSSSQLYLALGCLLQRAAIELEPQELTYVVKPMGKPGTVPPPPVLS